MTGHQVESFAGCCAYVIYDSCTITFYTKIFHRRPLVLLYDQFIVFEGKKKLKNFFVYNADVTILCSYKSFKFNVLQFWFFLKVRTVGHQTMSLIEIELKQSMINQPKKFLY